MENYVNFGWCKGLATVSKQIDGTSDFSVTWTSRGMWSPSDLIWQGMFAASCEINFWSEMSMIVCFRD